MKIYSLILGFLLVFALSTSPAFAAETTKTEKSAGMVPAPLLGVMGGINVASLNGSTPGAVFESRLGFVGGAFLNFHLGSSLAVQPEFLYSQKGGKINGKDYQLEYMEVPVLLEVAFGKPGFVPGILLGPAFNTNIANKGVVNVKKSDVGLIVGAQVVMSKFLFGGRYEIGLMDLSSDSDVRSGTFTFLVGLSFL